MVPEEFNVFRSVWVADESEVDLKDPGLFWAETPEGASRSGFGSEPGKSLQVTLIGETQRKFVDIKTTISRRRTYGEPEVALTKPPTEVKIYVG